MSHYEFLRRFDRGDVSGSEIISGFQALVSDPSIKCLVGDYRAYADELIRRGFIHGR